MGRNATQPGLENRISKSVSAWTLRLFFKARSSTICLTQHYFQRWHSLHKVASVCTGPLYKGVQHFFERNIGLFSKRIAACAKLQRSAPVLQKECQVIYKETYSCAKFFSRGKGIYVRSFKTCWCRYGQSFLYRGVNHLIEKHAIIQRSIDSIAIK